MKVGMSGTNNSIYCSILSYHLLAFIYPATSVRSVISCSIFFLQEKVVLGPMAKDKHMAGVARREQKTTLPEESTQLSILILALPVNILS